MSSHHSVVDSLCMHLTLSDHLLKFRLNFADGDGLSSLWSQLICVTGKAICDRRPPRLLVAQDHKVRYVINPGYHRTNGHGLASEGRLSDAIFKSSPQWRPYLGTTVIKR